MLMTLGSYRMEEARIIFKAGKNRDGYFDADDLLAQVNTAIDIHESLFSLGNVRGLFAFNNAPSHQKRSPDALSARHLPKNPKVWHPSPGVRMHDAQLADGTRQPLYHPDDHPSHPGQFKGIKVLIEERGLWSESDKLNAECAGFKCPPGRTDCCCRRLLFTQPDFEGQKCMLQEYFESRGLPLR